MRQLLVPRFLLLCGLTHRRPRDRLWRSKAGLQLTGFGPHGFPFGRARVILLYLANKAAQSGRWVFGTLGDIRAMFRVDWSLDNLEQHLLRTIECLYTQVDVTCERCAPCRWPRGTLDVIRWAHYCETDCSFELELGDELIPNARNSFTCPMEPAATLIRERHLQALDLYLWYHWMLSRHDLDPPYQIDPFGPEGPFGLAPIAIEGPRQRQAMREIHRAVLGVWHSCPFRLDSTRGHMMIVCDLGARERYSLMVEIDGEQPGNEP